MFIHARLGRTSVGDFSSAMPFYLSHYSLVNFDFMVMLTHGLII